MFKKHHAMIKEERRRQAEEMSMTVMKQIDEIQKIKRSIELENFEARRKRAEVLATDSSLLFIKLKKKKINSHTAFFFYGLRIMITVIL